MSAVNAALLCVPVILAGGSGARLWPLSTPENPKQFMLKGAFGRSLFQTTVLRVANRASFAAPLVVANISHRDLLYGQLAQIGCDDAHIIFEPVARNTAAAITLAALHLAPEERMLVLPSDHSIDQPDMLLEAIARAAPAVDVGHIMLFAMTPRDANTGYGYIEIGGAVDGLPGIHLVRRFSEKPDATTAASFLKAGNYGWNSGIFLMRAATVLEEMECHAPEIMRACRLAMKAATRDGLSVCADEAAFAHAPSAPFDRAVMERTSRAMVIKLAMGWRDMGSWEALAESADAKT